MTSMTNAKFQISNQIQSSNTKISKIPSFDILLAFACLREGRDFDLNFLDNS